MTQRQICAPLILALLLAAPAARANDGAYMGEGATVYATKEQRVVMERERVVIRYDAKAKYHLRWVADCRFTFRNKTKRAVEVQMGHPDWRPRGEAPGPWALRGFKVWVDGKLVAAKHKVVADSRPGRDVPVRRLPRRVRLRLEAAYTWKVRLKPGGKVEVRNVYRFGGGSSNGPARDCFRRQERGASRRLFWRRVRPPKGGFNFDHNGSCSTTHYIVTTGRTWGGPIGDAEIAIQIPPGVWPHLVAPIPRAASISKGWVRWRFTRWTPRHELGVVFVLPIPSDPELGPPLFNSAAEAKIWLRWAKRNGVGRDMVALLRGAYAARDGATPPPSVAAFYRVKEWSTKKRRPKVDAAVLRQLEAYLGLGKR